MSDDKWVEVADISIHQNEETLFKGLQGQGHKPAGGQMGATKLRISDEGFPKHLHESALYDISSKTAGYSGTYELESLDGIVANFQTLT